ncbi:MAG: dihydroorotase [Hyphomonadaceae bacterium]
MSDVMISNARLLDASAGRDEAGDVLIRDGVIAASGQGVSAPDGIETIDAGGLCLAPGLIDLRVKTGEPGAVQKETLGTASLAAVAGGVTSMVVMPDTQPVIDDQALVEFVTRRGRDALNRIYPAGALTRGLAGEAMAELGLMADAGAVFFSNGERGVADSSVMKRALAYAGDIGARVCVRPEDARLIGSGVMNAGALAARMGLAGMGKDAELVAGLRDIVLAQQTGCSLILDQVTTLGLLDAVAAAKADGAKIGCTIAAHHLFFNELDVGDYLTYCKVSPPFRDEETRLALIDAVRTGKIDAVVSAHDPQPAEEKRVPFADAAFGAAGLETTLSAMLAFVADGQMDLLEALRPLTSGPADLAGLAGGTLADGALGDIVLFDPEKPWLCQREDLRSRSTNSPFDGRRMTGRVMATFVGGKRVFTRD